MDDTDQVVIRHDGDYETTYDQHRGSIRFTGRTWPAGPRDFRDPGTPA